MTVPCDQLVYFAETWNRRSALPVVVPAQAEATADPANNSNLIRDRRNSSRSNSNSSNRSSSEGGSGLSKVGSGSCSGRLNDSGTLRSI